MQPVMYWQNFRIWTEIREDLTVYWNRFRKQEAPAEHGSADRSTRVLKRTWPLTSVDELLVSQEDQPQTHHSTRQISREKGLTQSSVVGIIHHDLSLKFLKCPKSRHGQKLTAAIVSFSYTNVSQGSAATQLRCGGIFNNHVTLLQIFHKMYQWKNFENQLVFVKVTANDKWDVFWDTV